MRRKLPIRHTVKGHYRQGKHIKSYQRGKGTPRSKPQKRVVSFVEGLPTFKTLKQSGYWSAPEKDLDPGIREFVKSLNKLPYVATIGSCEGHTVEELLRRGYPSPHSERIKETYPLGYRPAHVSLFVLADRRFELWSWLKENVGLDKVIIQAGPVEGGPGYSKVCYRWGESRYIRDKVFQVDVVSKSLRMPFKNKRRV